MHYCAKQPVQTRKPAQPAKSPKHKETYREARALLETRKPRDDKTNKKK